MSADSDLREAVDLHLPIVAGAALKLAMTLMPEAQMPDRRRALRITGMSVYHWELHSSRVIALAKRLRPILPPPDSL